MSFFVDKALHCASALFAFLACDSTILDAIKYSII